jgi:hypothetical protein
MTPGEVTLSSYTYGDTWNGIAEITVAVGGNPPAENLASVEMELRPRNIPSKQAKLLASPDDITITNAANWVISIPAQDLALGAGKYDWYLTTVDAGGTRKTYVKGTIEVLRS